MPADLDEYLKGCHCGDVPEDDEKTFVYIEGTQLDKSLSEDNSVLSETVWHNLKPPQLFSSDYMPSVSARQVQIKRIQLQGKRKLAGDDEDVQATEKVNVSIVKKKAAVKYLSNTSIISDE